MVSQKPGFLSQNAGLRDVPRPYVRSIGNYQTFVHSPESPMSRRRLALVALASLVVSACASSTTAPSRDDATTVVSPKAVTSGSYDTVPTDTTGKAVTSGSY
jgi:hypothetical protein